MLGEHGILASIDVDEQRASESVDAKLTFKNILAQVSRRLLSFTRPSSTPKVFDGRCPWGATYNIARPHLSYVSHFPWLSHLPRPPRFSLAPHLPWASFSSLEKCPSASISNCAKRIQDIRSRAPAHKLLGSAGLSSHNDNERET